MRLALLTPGFSANEDDWCIPVLRNLARNLGHDHDVRVYALAYPGFAREYEVAGVPVVSFGDGRSGWPAQLRRLRQAYLRLRADHERRPLTLLHGFWADQGGLLAALAGRNLDIPCVVSVMAGELIYDAAVDYGKRRHPVSGRLATYGARHAQAVSVSSPYHLARLAAERPEIHAHCIVLGVDGSLFRPQGPATVLQGDPSLLMVGSLVPVKGHITALRALRRIRRRLPYAHLHLVGTGVVQQSLQEAVTKLGLATAVTFHGHIEHDRLPGLYRGCDLCLMTSHFENHGMVILEAAACGKVSVGTAVGLLPELLPADLLCKPGDDSGLGAAILELIASDERRKVLESEFRRAAEEHYCLANTVREFISVYERLAAGQPAA